MHCSGVPRSEVDCKDSRSERTECYLDLDCLYHIHRLLRTAVVAILWMSTRTLMWHDAVNEFYISLSDLTDLLGDCTDILLISLILLDSSSYDQDSGTAVVEARF